VAILQGFPGCGKSQLAREVACKALRGLDPVEPQQDSADAVQDLFLDLALALESAGLPRLAHELDRGEHADLGGALLETLRREPVLILVDEFQRLFPRETTSPPALWRTLVERLNNSRNSRGRLLLVSNRSIKPERWCENCRTEEVRGLVDLEAEALFTELLEASDLVAAVPLTRRREIAHRLGGNPRALKTLVGALRSDCLDDLLSSAPDLWKPGDVAIDPQLVEDFERELLERALPKLDAELLKFMRWLSIHRRPFRKEALAQFTGGREPVEILRQRLIERFLLDNDRGWNSPHPLAREISVTRLRSDSQEWVQAHSLAADYHFRPFKARRLIGTPTLAGSYAELRHHLFESGRIGELDQASERLTQYALSQVRVVTPVPMSKEALEERMALLLAVPDKRRPRVLEYHLALCLRKRGGDGDGPRALKHARAATGPHMFFAVWLLRLDLEQAIHGIDTALPVLDEALKYVSADENAFALYQHGGEMLARANRLDEAIQLLEKGIDVPGMASLSSLYQSCAELMAKANRLDEAIQLLEKGIDEIPSDKNLFSLYQSCAELMAKANRLDEAIQLLEKGIAVPGMANVFILYQAATEYVAASGDSAKAEAIVSNGLATVPKQFGRHKIAETGLRVFSARHNAAAIRGLLALTGPRKLDPPQRALADCLIARMSGDWTNAAEIAQEKRAEFPNYLLLRAFEADARLALGQVNEADNLIKEYRVGEGQVRDNPMVWLTAYLNLITGRGDDAASLAAMFAPNATDRGSPLDEVEMLRLWAIARNASNAPWEEMFPGLAEYRRRSARPSQVRNPLAEPERKQTAVLVVATEWYSRHGGLSTFNRDLCTALVRAGARVVCYVPRAETGERDDAERVHHVHIVEAPALPGADDSTLLLQRPQLPSGFVPEIVIGHDRITGAASVRLARDDFPGSKRVLFIHTSPEEIEWHKESREDSTSAERAEARKKEQLGLAAKCDLVIAVGPRLTREFATDLHGDGNPVPIMELTPGLPEHPASAAAIPPAIRCLVLGRVEDYQLKGLDLAAKALGRVVTGWKYGTSPKLVVRGAPRGTDAELRKRLAKDSDPTELDIVVRHYSADETEIQSDLREASLVLMPSKKEGFGLVGLEAISWGVPTLISEQSGLAETLRLHSPQRANDWILSVTGDCAAKWAERIEFLLANRQGAFERAASLREELAASLDWHRAVVALLAELSVNRAPSPPAARSASTSPSV
jgi:glycosyltransferase involved in cell wall biosynthesis/tetratricopeptide (TPR) repeat protein